MGDAAKQDRSGNQTGTDIRTGRDIETGTDIKTRTDIEDLTALVWQWGVFLATGVILLGLLLSLMRPAQGGPENLTSLRAVWVGIRQGYSNAIVMGGLLLLLATPMVNVAVAAIAFIVRRERYYVVISIAVLVILVVSMTTGQGH